MTDLGGAQARQRAVVPPLPALGAMPVAQPTSYGNAAYGNAALVSADSQAAARTAAAALSAARAAGPPRQWPVTTPAQPWRPVATAASPGPARRQATRPLAGIAVLQIVCWQLVLIAAVLVVGRPWFMIAAVGLGAMVVLALTAVRVRGRWVYEWLFLSSAYFLRDRDRNLTGADGTGHALLRVISPEAVGLVDNLGDDPVFMVSRTAGITAVLQPKSVTQDPAGIPGPETLLPPPNEEALAFAAQVTYHAGIDRRHPPRIWLALQALRTVDTYRDADIQRALANALRRVQRRLRRDGLPTIGLAESEFLGALASLAHVTAGRSRVREQWRLWHSGSVPQATFRLDGWARLSPAAVPQMVHGLLTATHHTAVTITVTASRSAMTEPRVDAALRIAAASPPALEHAVQTLTRLAGAWGVGMERLDGQHARGMAATLPIGVADW
ncbi:type VII secretion protein EccE [Kutzneria sp. CA-103260]|uniref:type VII secretion protein EccE n=1 Tax=Kutzneria sp. CA-103260 TaxID=2802641 RepID=UPI001BED7A41|nr:type VII secretion protein EccE [Kutzneria sp. CA-103260]QUQ67176.1 Putative type VII ESX secretion system translocon, EccE [Kutzneria sp. CA-103260]